MDIQYFKSAWGDIRNSRGWFGKLCLLALLGFIPIFGPIVALAYVYGWAREIAWGTHEPMPAKIFSNEDGKFWRRGWFVFVLMFVFLLVPGILYIVGATMDSTQYVMTWYGPQAVVDPVMQGVGALLRVLGLIGIIVMSVFAWVGCMRVSIYDRLSAGFQFGKIFKMMRHDTRGIMRVFGMELLVSLIIGIVLSVIFAILAAFVIAAGVAGLMQSGFSLQSWQYMTQAQQLQVVMYFIASAGVVGIFAALVMSFLGMLASLFVNLLVVRAVGYWTMQFEVPIWGGQDDPMPFELVNEPEPEPVQQQAPPPPAPSQSASAPGFAPEQEFTAQAQPAPAPQPAPPTSLQPEQPAEPAFTAAQSAQADDANIPAGGPEAS